MGVKPTKSQNSTDTCRSSVLDGGVPDVLGRPAAPDVPEAGAGAAGWLRGLSACSGTGEARRVPHSLQKRASEARVVPQFGHERANGWPH